MSKANPKQNIDLTKFKVDSTPIRIYIIDQFYHLQELSARGLSASIYKRIKRVKL